MGDQDSGLAVVIDPAWDVDILLSVLEKNKLSCKYIANTHAHFDHVEGNTQFQEKTGAKIIMHASSKLKKDLPVKDGDDLNLGKIRMKFIHTPGHSPESMCIIVNDFALITGDTLFIGECGRVDLPGGDAGQLFESFQKLKKLDPHLIVYPGHDYGETRSSILGEQIQTNYTMAQRTKEEFIAFMTQP